MPGLFTVCTPWTLLRSSYVAHMTRMGLSIDELVARTWVGGHAERYVARSRGLHVLECQVVALIGAGAPEFREHLSTAIEGCVPIDGPAAAHAGTLRIHAMQAARVGLRAIAVSDPLRGLSPTAAGLALADLAGLGDLGMTVVVDLADAESAALVADRVVVVADGMPDRAYPVLAPHPRSPREVAAVTARALATLAA